MARLRFVDGGAGGLLGDGSRARLAQFENRVIVGRDGQFVTSPPVWAPVAAGDVVVAWWGTTTATSTPPTRQELAVPEAWTTFQAIPLHWELAKQYPARHGWIVVVTARATAAMSASAMLVAGQQDVRALPVQERPNHLGALGEPAVDWWRPHAWAFADAESVLDVAWLQAPAAHVHAAPAPLGGIGSTRGLQFVAVDWDSAVSGWLNRLTADPKITPVPEAAGFGYHLVGGDPADTLSTDAASWELWTRDMSWFSQYLKEHYPQQYPIDFDVLAQTLRAVPVTVTISDSPDVPLRPVLTSLTGNGFADGSAGHTLRWEYRRGVASDQTAFQVRRVLDGVTTYWSVAAQAWVSSATWNGSPAAQVVLPPGAVPNGVVTGLSVRTRATGEGSLWSPQVSTSWVDPASVSVAILGADAGGAVADQTPTVVTSAVPGGGAQILAWQGELRTGGGALIESAASGRPDPWTPATPLEDGVTYLARVRVQQSGGMWSAWVPVLFTVRVHAPGAPVVTASIVDHAVSGLPGVQVEATLADDGFPYESASSVLRVQRSADDGNSWATVAVTGLPPLVRTAWVRDWEPPTGWLSYRVRVEARGVDGNALVGAWGAVQVAAPVPASASGWVQPHGRPEAAVRIRLASDEDREIDLRVERHAPIGLPSWIVTGDVAMQQTGTLSAQAWSAAERDALLDLLTSGEVLRLTFCPERRLDDQRIREAAEVLTFRVGPGSVTVSRPASGPTSYRRVTWPWTSAPWPSWPSEA